VEIRYVEWMDSLGSGGWIKLSEAKEYRPQLCKTVGFVVEDGDQYVTFSLCEDTQAGDNNHVDNVLCIPKFAITKSKTLKK
jgi:hypothetical protein